MDPGGQTNFSTESTIKMLSVAPAVTRLAYRSLTLCCLAGILTSFAGCGGSEIALAPVTGFVTEGGEPVVGAMVEFFPENGRTSVAQTVEGGAFTMRYSDEEGVAIGACTVQITPGMGDAPSAEGEDVMAPPMKGPPKVIVIPDSVTVEDSDTNSFVFELDDYKNKKRKR